MGCFRIVTLACIEQLRKAQNNLAAAAIGIAVPEAGLLPGSFQLIRNTTAIFNQLVGDVTERITQRGLGGEKAYNLNKIEHNFKVYDVSNQDHIASVKAYGLDQGTLSSMTTGNYLRELRVATGLSHDAKHVAKFEAAAQALRQAASQSSLPLPSALQGMQTTEATCAWLRQNAEVRIPDDHVAQVRSAVERSVIQRPQNYGLDPDASYAEKADVGKQLAQRVQPMGMSTVEIHHLIDQTIQKHF